MCGCSARLLCRTVPQRGGCRIQGPHAAHEACGLGRWLANQGRLGAACVADEIHLAQNVVSPWGRHYRLNIEFRD